MLPFDMQARLETGAPSPESLLSKFLPQLMRR